MCVGKVLLGYTTQKYHQILPSFSQLSMFCPLAPGLPYIELLVTNVWNPSLLFYGIKEVCIQRAGDVVQRVNLLSTLKALGSIPSTT